MNVGEIMSRITVTKQMVDEVSGEYIHTDYKVKSTDGYLEQLKNIIRQKDLLDTLCHLQN